MPCCVTTRALPRLAPWRLPQLWSVGGGGGGVHPRGLHKCPRCDYASFSKRSWRRHVTTKHPGGRACDMCSCHFYDAWSYKAHRPECLRRNKDNPRKFICMFCQASFETRLSGKHHQASCAGRRNRLGRRGAVMLGRGGGGGDEGGVDPEPDSGEHRVDSRGGSPTSPRPGPSREGAASPVPAPFPSPLPHWQSQMAVCGIGHFHCTVTLLCTLIP